MAKPIRIDSNIIQRNIGKNRVAYINQTIDEPIAELNGHTLREVFEDGNLLPDLNVDNWTTSATGNTLINYNDGLKYTFDNNLPSISSQFIENKYSIQSSVGDKLVSIVKIKGDKVSTYRVGQQNVYPLSGNIELQYTYKVVLTDHLSNSRFYLLTNANENLSLNDNIYIQDMKLINLSQLGINSSIDILNYYSLYQARKNIAKKVLTYANIFEELNYNTDTSFDENNGGITQFLTDTTVVYDDVNKRIKCISNVDGAFGGYLGFSLPTIDLNLGDRIYVNQDFQYQLNIYNPLFIKYSFFTASSRTGNDISTTTSQILEANQDNDYLRLYYNAVNSLDILAGDFIALKHLAAVNLKHFDELITKEQLDTMLEYYLEHKDHNTTESNAYLSTEEFFSGSMGRGWRLTTNEHLKSSLEIDNILVRDTFRTHIFQKDIIKATNGQLYVSDSGVVDSVDITNNIIYFKDSKSASFDSGATIVVKDVADDGSSIETVTFTVGTAGASTNGITGYPYTLVSGDVASIEGGMTAVRISGPAILLNATEDAVKGTPYIDAMIDGNTKVRIGSLNGAPDGTGYGLYGENVFLTGKITANDGYIGDWIIDNSTGELKSDNGSIILNADTSTISVSTGGKLLLGEAGDSNYLHWDPTQDPDLNIKGTIGGEISEISVGSVQISDRLSIDEDGIIANNGTETTFSLDSNTGNAYFKGHIEALSGTFAGQLMAATGIFSGTLAASVITNIVSETDTLYDPLGSASAAEAAAIAAAALDATTKANAAIAAAEADATAKADAAEAAAIVAAEADAAAKAAAAELAAITAAATDATGKADAAQAAAIAAAEADATAKADAAQAAAEAAAAADATAKAAAAEAAAIAYTEGYAVKLATEYDKVSIDSGGIKIWDTAGTNVGININSTGISTSDAGFVLNANNRTLTIGDVNNWLIWDANATPSLNIKGTIGGQISQMSLGELIISDRLHLTADGIFATDSLGNETFSLFANTGNAVFSGTIYAAAGEIGGWSINTGNLSTTGMTLDATNSKVTVGTGIVIDGANSKITFGNTDYIQGDEKFSLGNGNVTWNGVTLSVAGTINAKAGLIGSSATNKWTIGTNTTNASIYNGRSGYSTAAAGIYIGTDGIALGSAIANAEFRVTNAGALNATSATIEGKITAKSGRIGSTTDGWDINANTLQSKNDYIVLDAANNRIDVGDITLQGGVKTTGTSYIGLRKTSYALDATAGIYFGIEANVAKFSMGTNTGNSISWDGNTLAIKGNLSASTGTFGEVAVNKGNVLLGGSNPLIVRNNTTELFKIASNGVLTAGGWIIDSSSIYTGTKVVNGNYTAAESITIGSTGYISTNQFRVDTDGKAYFKGTLNAPGGDIGGWILSSTQLANKASSPNAVFNGDDTNPYFALGKMTYASTTSGAFIGFTGGTAQMHVGDATNYMKWTGSMLDIKGSIGGEISEISVGSVQISDRLTIDEDGIVANNGAETTFSLDSNTGNAYFKGHIEATSGTFSGALQAATGTFTGILSAATGSFSGAITATSGFIGNASKPWTIGGNTTRGWIYNGKASVSDTAAGVYLGTDGISLGTNATNKITLAQNGTAFFGDKLTWNGSELYVNGDIGGDINEIVIGNPDGTGGSDAGIRISDNGIVSYKSAVPMVTIDSSGDAIFKGIIEADSGLIGAWEISSTGLVFPGDLGFIGFNGVQGNIPEIWLGEDASSFSGGTTLNQWKIGLNAGAIGFFKQTSLGVYQTLSVTPFGVNTTSQDMTLQSGEDLLIKSSGSLDLESTNDSIWVKGNGSSRIQLKSASIGTLVSSRIIKKDIEELDSTELEDFIEKIEIKQFKYKADNKNGISLIIEDEQDKDLPFKDALFTREYKIEKYNSFNEIPDWLREYKDTPSLTEESGKYYFNPLMYNIGNLTNISIAVLKNTQEKIKNLEKENKLIDKKMKDIKKDNENVREENKLLRERLRIIEENLQELNKKWET